MKRFRLPPIARQLIIFLLLIAILWQDKPLVGPDGLMLIEFTDFPAGKLQTSLAEGDYINICESIDNQSGGSRTQFILAAVPLARATWREPNKAYLLIDMYIPLRRIFPKRLRFRWWMDTGTEVDSRRVRDSPGCSPTWRLSSVYEGNTTGWQVCTQEE